MMKPSVFQETSLKKYGRGTDLTNSGKELSLYDLKKKKTNTAF